MTVIRRTLTGAGAAGAVLASALALAACNSSSQPAPAAIPCNIVVSGAASYSGSCAASAQLNAGQNEVVFEAAIPDAGNFPCSANIAIPAGTGFDAGTYTFPGSGGTVDCGAVWGAGGGYNSGAILLVIDSVGPVSTVDGVQTWNDLKGSLVAIAPDDGYMGDGYGPRVLVSMNFGDSADSGTALLGFQPVLDAGVTVTDSDGNTQNTTIPLAEASAFGHSGVTVIDIGAGLNDGGQYEMALEIGALAVGTYTSANIQSGWSSYYPLDDIPCDEWSTWTGSPPTTDFGAFSMTITDVGTSTAVGDIMVTTGMHGTFTDSPVSLSCPAMADGGLSVISVTGSF